MLVFNKLPLFVGLVSIAVVLGKDLRGNGKLIVLIAEFIYMTMFCNLRCINAICYGR